MGCERIFIASDHPLPLIEFDPENMDFWVGEFDAAVRDPDDKDLSVRQLFTKPYVYYVGSYMGCGCGFDYAPETLQERYPGCTEEECLKLEQEFIKKYYQSEEDYRDKQRLFEEMDKAGRQSVQKLRSYLRAATKLGTIELYVRWGYDPIGEPKFRRTVTPRFFGGANFSLNPIHEALLTVRKANIK